MRIFASRNHRESVGCPTPTSAESVIALIALGPIIRSTIRFRNAVLYSIVLNPVPPGPSSDRCGNYPDAGGGGGGTAICDSGFDSSNLACADCLTNNCCAEFKACGFDPNCNDCLIKQDQAKCDKGMKDEAADGCLSNNCMNECM